GNNPRVADTWTPLLHPNADPAEGERYKAMGETAYMRDKEQQALQFIWAHPSEVLRFSGHKFVYTWLGVDGPVQSFLDPYLAGKLLMNIPLASLMLLGIIALWRERHVAAAPFTFVILIFPAVYYVTHPLLRYRFPIDPVMVVLASHGAAYATLALRSRRTRQG